MRPGSTRQAERQAPRATCLRWFRAGFTAQTRCRTWFPRRRQVPRVAPGSWTSLRGTHRCQSCQALRRRLVPTPRPTQRGKLRLRSPDLGRVEQRLFPRPVAGQVPGLCLLSHDMPSGGIAGEAFLLREDIVTGMKCHSREPRIPDRAGPPGDRSHTSPRRRSFQTKRLRLLG